MTCDRVRELLPEFLLGSLDDIAAGEVRRHLRGCTACREEQSELEEGIDALSRATHDREPPAELRGRVLEVLGEEWRDEASTPASAPAVARRRPLIAAAAVLVALLALSIGYGVAQRQRAVVAQADAASYRSILDTLGGRDFRLGAFGEDGWSGGLAGQVVVYDGETDDGWTSWVLVFLQGGEEGEEVTATLVAPDGRTLPLPPMTIHDGEASAWIVTHDDLTAFDELTVTGPDGLRATTRIRDA